MSPIEPKGVQVVPYRNDSGETIPAYGLIKITNAVLSGNDYLAKGEKPDPDTDPDHTVFYVNGPVDVADGDEGYCYVPTGSGWVYYDNANTPAVGEDWGPEEDSWKLGKDGSGFKIVSSLTSGDYVWAERAASGCKNRNEFWQITVFGFPTGGDFAMGLVINGTSGALTFNYDDTSTDVQTEMETHAEISSGDVDVSGGPFPEAAMNIEFKGNLANSAIPFPTINWSTLTGGTGVAVTVSRYQPGYPNDAS